MEILIYLEDNTTKVVNVNTKEEVFEISEKYEFWEYKH